VSLCGAAVRGCLDGVEVRWDARAALGVVMAAGGYPDHYRTGDPIRGLEAADALPGKVFHAGTRASGPQVLTAGGRVLCAVGLGERIADARREAYELVHAIHWEGAQYRRDIGERALAQARP
jgi:phosphoribosylamine---glycine ligase